MEDEGWFFIETGVAWSVKSMRRSKNLFGLIDLKGMYLN